MPLRGELLNPTEDNVRRWKEYFEGLNSISMCSVQEADLAGGHLIFGAEVTEAVKQLHIGGGILKQQHEKMSPAATTITNSRQRLATRYDAIFASLIDLLNPNC